MTKEEKRVYDKIYYQNNKDKRKIYFKQYRKDCEKQIKEYYLKNQQNKREYSKIYFRQNKDKKYQYVKKRKQIDVHFKLKMNIRSLVNSRLKKHLLSKNYKSTFSFLPYTVDELKQHLENQFEPWMNWNNWSNKQGHWTIDHKKADSLFNYKSVEDEEFQKCWALENLQPMEYIKNVKKSNKLLL